MNNFTSFEFSKKLFENGCRLKTHKFWRYYRDFKLKDGYPTEFGRIEISNNVIYNFACFDILWDICLKYAKEFFGDEVCSIFSFEKDIEAYYFYPQQIFTMFQNGKTKEEIEEYIWDNCLFNKCKK